MSSTPLIVNFPELFASLTSAPLPAGVQSLGQTLVNGKAQTPQGEAMLASLPISCKEARLRVSAMREAAGNLWEDGSIKALEAYEQRRQDEAWEHRQEDLALQAFMADQEPSLATPAQQKKQNTPAPDPLLSRQLQLFIALFMEQDALEHREALDKLFAAEGLLRQAISGHSDPKMAGAADTVDTDDLLELLDEQVDMDFHDEEHAPVVHGNKAFTFAREEFSLPGTASATVMADVLLALLPRDSCLFTCHAGTCARLKELEPEQVEDVTLPCVAGDAEGPASAMRLKTGILYGWKLAGLSAPPADAPWLCRSVRLYWKDGG